MMKLFTQLSLAALLLVAGMNVVLAAQGPLAVDLKGDEAPEKMQQAYTNAINGLLPGLAKNDGNAVQKFEATLHNAARPGAEPERLACCQAIAAALESDAAVEAKIWLMKLVTFAGRAEVVPVLNKLLNDKDTVLREYARCALQQNPAPEAAKVLRDTLLHVWHGGAEAEWQAALALALGARKDVPSLEGMFTLLGQKNETVQDAALAGMGSIATVEPVRGKPGIWKSMPEKLQGAAAETYMKTAEHLLVEGKTNEAAEIYRELSGPEVPRPIRQAGLAGLLKTSGDATNVLEILAGNDGDARAIALGVIPDLGSQALQGLAAGLGKLPLESQFMVLTALAERGEKAALPTALEFAKSKDEKLRLAGLEALGRLGDASTVEALVETLPAGGPAGGVARDSLTKVSGPQVNEKIMAAMQAQTDTGRRAALIEVLESRSAGAAVPLLLQECVSESSTVRRPAMRALGKLAQPTDVPAMLKGLLKSSPGGEREEAEKAIANVCARSSGTGKQAEAVLALYQTGGAAQRTELLPVLGRIGGGKIFEVIKAALSSTNPEMSQAALNAMSNWPDSDEAVENELLTQAQKAEKSADRAGALRAYIRLIATPSGLPENVRLAKFQKAMDLAGGDGEKNLVLEGVADIKRIEVLRFVAPYLDKPALAQKACNATLDLARDRGLRRQNKAEFQAALEKVLAVCKDKALLERANRYLQEKL